ncbi:MULTISPECIES: hypothetical protein [unclassified Leclercia]|uniref:hypothetical protein n=1 Tax=unclassified Leclercia TaxID=2627398 RepID=UPI0025C2F0B0|nr:MULTISPECIES: hypothetical protein [unclassified Leclercia]
MIITKNNIIDTKSGVIYIYFVQRNTDLTKKLKISIQHDEVFMFKERLKATNVALLIVINARLYAEEKGKAITRYRLTRRSFKLLAQRSALHATFVASVNEELQELGWQLIEDPDGNFAFFDTGIIDNWARLSIKRVKELRKEDEDDLVRNLLSYQTEEDEEQLDD